MSESIKKLYASGYQNPAKGVKHSAERRRKKSEAQKKLWEDQNYRKHMSKVHKGKISPKKGKKVSEEIKLKSSKTWFKKGQVPHNKGKQMSEESRRKNSEAKKKLYASGFQTWNKGKRMSVESRQKMSESRKGIPAWNKGLSAKYDERVKHQADAKRGFKHSEESKRKMSESLKGRPSWNKGKRHTESHKMKLRKARAGRKYPYYDTIPEKIVQSLLHKNNINFVKQKIFKMPEGRSHKTDIFVEPNICIEADGDYWHTLNQKRDELVNFELKKQGMSVLRFWESDLKTNPEKCLQKIIKAIKESKR